MSDEGLDQRAVEGIELELVGTVDAFAVEGADELRRVLVRVHDDARRGLTGLVQASGIGGADVDPDAEGPGEVADEERRLVRLGDPLREGDALRVLEAV